MHRLEHLGRYELLEELGRGAMGAVYKARDPGIDRLAAVKVLATAPDRDPGEARQHRERFQREARAAGRLAHLLSERNSSRTIPYLYSLL